VRYDDNDNNATTTVDLSSASPVISREREKINLTEKNDGKRKILRTIACLHVYSTVSYKSQEDKTPVISLPRNVMRANLDGGCT